MRKSQLIFLRIIVIFATLFSLPIGGAVVASAKADVTLSDFVGNWESNGVTFGRPAHSILRWHPALNGKFMRVEYEIKSADESEALTIFKGLGYYQLSDAGFYKAFWADNSGDLHPITAKINGRTLVSTWGVAGGKLGRTHYKLNVAGQIEVTDWLLREEGWRQFNHNKFSRVEPAEDEF